MGPLVGWHLHQELAGIGTGIAALRAATVDMEGIQLSEPRIVPTGGNVVGGKRKAEGKDALLAVKPPPLETKASSPHKADRSMCGSALSNMYSWYCVGIVHFATCAPWQSND